MYIRIKKRGKQKYAYLVRNKRYKRKKHPRQITIKYLGRLFVPELKEKRVLSEDLDEYFEKNKSKNIIKDLLELELRSCGFKKSKGVWKSEGCIVNLNRLEVFNLINRPMAIELNEGFMTGYTLKKLLKYKYKPSTTPLEQGEEFANLLIACGIKIDEEVFLRLFDKIHNP